MITCAMPGCDQTLADADQPNHGWLVLDWLGAGGVTPYGETVAYLPLYFCRLLHAQQWIERLPDAPEGIESACISYVRHGPAAVVPHPSVNVLPHGAWLLRTQRTQHILWPPHEGEVPA